MVEKVRCRDPNYVVSDVVVNGDEPASDAIREMSTKNGS
jgi:hypothetical protein